MRGDIVKEDWFARRVDDLKRMSREAAPATIVHGGGDTKQDVPTQPVDSLIETAIEDAAKVCDDHAEELIAMIGKDLGPNYGEHDRLQRDKLVKDQAYTARICAQRIRASVKERHRKEGGDEQLD